MGQSPPLPYGSRHHWKSAPALTGKRMLAMVIFVSRCPPGADVLGRNVRRPGLYTQPEPARSVAMQRSRCHGGCSTRGRCTAPGGVGGNFRPHRMHCVTTDN